MSVAFQHSDWFEIQIPNLLVESLDSYLYHVTPLSARRLDDFGCKLRGRDENRDLLDSNWLDIVHEVAPYCSLDGQDGDDSLEVVVIVLEADLAFLILPVASAARKHQVSCWMFLPQNKELSVV